MATFELDPIMKTFQDGDDEVVAVDDISMSTDDGEFLAVVNPPGCGKSTTLRMIVGLETITSGAILLSDHVINDVASQDHDIATASQSRALYPHMIVHQNMSFGLEESTDLPGGEIGRMVSGTVYLLDIPSLLDRKPSDLSGGQRQCVALGRVITRDPEVLLIGEPFSNLDAKLHVQIRIKLQRLQDDLGVTTVYVTHNQTEAMMMDDRIAILDGREPQRIATPLECYHEPADQLAVSLFGEPSMNFFDMACEGDRLVGGSFEYPVGTEIRNDIGDMADLVLGIQPESVELVEAASGGHGFEMTAGVVELMSDENMLYLYFEPDVNPEIAETLVATMDGLTRISPDEMAVVWTPEEAIHFFDGRTGETLHNRSMEEATQQIDLG